MARIEFWSSYPKNLAQFWSGKQYAVEQTGTLYQKYGEKSLLLGGDKAISWTSEKTREGVTLNIHPMTFSVYLSEEYCD